MPDAAGVGHGCRLPRRRREAQSGRRVTLLPGSPALAQQWLRPQDRALLLELHPQAQQRLKQNVGKIRASAHTRDCYEGLTALVPPPIRRGLVLLDPSYEVKQEYRQIAALAVCAHKRWANAIYAIWYPLLPAARQRALLAALEQSGMPRILLTELTVADGTDQSGMYGSGMLIVNAPWQIDNTLAALLPAVANRLAPVAARPNCAGWSRRALARRQGDGSPLGCGRRLQVAETFLQELAQRLDTRQLGGAGDHGDAQLIGVTDNSDIQAHTVGHNRQRIEVFQLCAFQVEFFLSSQARWTGWRWSPAAPWWRCPSP